MIKETAYVIADGFLPYRNQAVEEYLMRTVRPGSCIMYLWQNRRTVVIGRNQNGRAECRAQLLEEDGGYLARRLSGGGAVFHDLGNLNFSFLTMDPDYSVARNHQVILRAVRQLGIDAAVTGRNDITADGRKFSGNAFMASGPRHCHHGTLLIGADTSDMNRYLSVDPLKLQSKGVASVRSRVVNLMELKPDITVEGVMEGLISAFGEEYSLTPLEIKPRELDGSQLRRMTERFSSQRWLYERQPGYTLRRKGRFPWGGAEICLEVAEGRVKNAVLYTDSMDEGLSEALCALLRGLPADPPSLIAALTVPGGNEARREALKDISTLITEAE